MYCIRVYNTVIDAAQTNTLEGEKESKMLNAKEMMKWVREEAKNNGMTFVKQNTTINGQQGYKLIERGNPCNVIDSNFTLLSAFTLAYESGFSCYKESI
jgi:hypothetical protein